MHRYQALPQQTEELWRPGQPRLRMDAIKSRLVLYPRVGGSTLGGRHGRDLLPCLPARKGLPPLLLQTY